MHQTIHARSALLPDGFARDVRVAIVDGAIAGVETGVAAAAGDVRAAVALPGMPNLHSHAFQRAMAGLAEVAGPSADTFWTWRVLMYDVALKLTPDEIEAVAARLYMDMLEAGFTRVGEFHYLHHREDGGLYDDIAETAARIAAASAQTGIALTLLPVFYAHATFGGAEPNPGQRRFVTGLDDFARLAERSRAIALGLEGGRFGIAPHSLRAVTPEELASVVPLAAGGPVHIHAAEQVKEVEDCLAWSGQRPVEWLLDHAGLDERWCLIHATHMTEDEARRLARTGAVAGLCPITEANLGDGIFRARDFLDAGGRLGVGSDSNVSISVAGELRQLEYSQRLAHRERNVIARPGRSTARRLFEEALAGGGAALAAPTGLVAGAPADIVSLDGEALAYHDEDAALGAFLFGAGIGVDGVWARGRQVVAQGRHVAREAILARYAKAMRRLVG